MNKAVELLTKWDAFDQNYPDGSLADFCRYYLALEAEPQEDGQLRGTLLKNMGRIMSAFNMYHRAAMAQIEMPSSESFYFLNGIAHHSEIKKTDLINYLFFEYTTGMEAINKLLKNELIMETVDEDDKRAKLLCLTEKGKALLGEGYRQSAKVGEMIFKDVPADAIRLANQLLSPIEKKHSKLAVSLKNTEFDKMYKTVCE